MIHQGILHYRRGRYLWWALLLILASVALYSTQGARQEPGGGTWQGYVLGTLGALLIIWLTLLGIRKRRYSSRLGTVQGWTAAHVMLGLALIVVATLHCAGQFGWNVHTLTYVLMCLVIGSGIIGLYLYLSYPRQMVANSGGRPRAQLFAELYELDRKGRELCKLCDPDVNVVVKSSIERTAVGGGVYRQLFSIDDSFYVSRNEAGPPTSLTRNADQVPAIRFVAARVPNAAKRAEAANLQSLVVVLCRRQAVLRQIREDIRLHAWLRIWLYVHVPLTFALLSALAAHILSTFLYW